jgi:hypothetical protein
MFDCVSFKQFKLKHFDVRVKLNIFARYKKCIYNE